MATFYVLAPSYFAQIANGLLILIFLYIVLSNCKSFLKSNYITQLQIIGTLAIALGVYGYNPLLIFA